MEDAALALIIIPTIFIGMPWLIFHYVTKWKTAPKLTQQDETLLDEMHQLSRRLEDRLQTVERIIAADNPDWRPGLNVPEPQTDYRLEQRELYRGDFAKSERSN